MSEHRVAHVLRKYDPAQWGGTETYIAEVTRRLVAVGWGCDLYAPDGPTTPDRALSKDVRLVRYHSFAPFLASAKKREALIANAGNIASFDLPRRILRDRGLELVHLHTGGRIGGAVRVATKLTGRPYVIAAHGPILADPDVVSRETRKRYDRVIDLGKPIGVLFGARRVIDDAARVIAFNEAERAALAQRIGDRAVRMDHGVDAARFATGDAARARNETFRGLGEGPIVLAVGRLSEQKNQLLSVRAFARAAPREYRLVCAGAQTDLGYRDLVEREASALGVRDRVLLLGNVDSSKLPDLFARADVVLAPSTHETFGLVVLEAWASRRPMLFAARSGMADLRTALGPDDDAAIPTLEVGDWADKLGAFLRDPSRRSAAAEAGFSLVSSRFSWDIVVRKLTRLYEEVIAGSKQSRDGGRRARYTEDAE